MNHEKFVADIFNVKNKTIIITGSAGRVGSKFSETLGNAGANLVLIDTDITKNRKLGKKLSKNGVKSLVLQTDISQESQLKDMIKEVRQKFKTIDVLINNAHYVKRDHPDLNTKFEKFPLDLWDEMINVNFRSLFLCCKIIGNEIIKQKNTGSIVNISSIYGITGADQRIYGKSKLNSPAFYAVTKGGMVNFTRYLASYWAKNMIRVNTLTLGGVYDKELHKDKKFVKNYSEKTMIGRMSNKEDYDGAILFLASDASRYMTGSNVIVDGGWTAW